MAKVKLEYDIPIQDRESCDHYNKLLKELSHDGNFEPIVPTEDHIENLLVKIYTAIERVGRQGGWYTSDSIKVKVEIEYEPENK